MTTSFKHQVSTLIGTTPVDVVAVDTGFRVTVIGCNLANTTEYDTINVSAYVVDASSTPGTYIRNIPIPPNTSLKLITNGEKLILPQNTSLRIVSDRA